MTFACPETDAPAWDARNRVLYYQERFQTWVIARAVDRDTPDNAQLVELTGAVLSKWWGEDPVTDNPAKLWLGGTKIGAADLITIGAPSATPIELPGTVQRWLSLPGPLPLLRPGRVVYVPVRFVWRSVSIPDQPWPTRRVGLFFSGSCPIENDWMLASVGDVSKQDAPPEVTHPILEGIKSELTPAIPIWIPISVGIIGLAYALNSVTGAARLVRR